MIKEQLIRVNPGHAQPLHNQPSETLKPHSLWETGPIERDASLPPHFQGLSSPPARYSSPANTPRTPLAPPRLPRLPKPMVKIFANSYGTSSTATPSSDVLPSASPRYAHASTAVEGDTDRLGSQDNKFDAAGTSDIAEEAVSYGDVTSQLTRGRSEAPTRSPEHGSHSARGPKMKTGKALPPAYDEPMSHKESMSQEESTEDGPSSSAAATGFEALSLRPSSLREVFPPPWSPGCSEPPRTNIAESPVASTSVEAVDEINANQTEHDYQTEHDNQTDYESAVESVASSHDVEDISWDTGNPINGDDSSHGAFTFGLVDPHRDTTPPTPPLHRTYSAKSTWIPPPVPPAKPEVTLKMPSTQTSPTPPPPIITRFRLPPSSSSPSPPLSVPFKLPSPIFNPAALGYGPTTDTRVDPLRSPSPVIFNPGALEPDSTIDDARSIPPQTTLHVVRVASMSKRVPTDRTSVAEGSSTAVRRRRRMVSDTSVPGRELILLPLPPMPSFSAHSDKRSQSAVVGPSYNVDLLGPGDTILEQEWSEKSELPYSNVPGGWGKRLPLTPPTELEIRDKMNDLRHGVEFKYSSSSCGVAPGLLRIKCPPSDFPSRDSPSLPSVSERTVCLPPKTPGHICAGRSLDIVFYRGDATALPMFGRGDRIEGHINLKNTKDICQIDITVRFLSGHLPGLVTAHRTAPTGIGSSLLLSTRSPANHPDSLKAFST